MRFISKRALVALIALLALSAASAASASAALPEFEIEGGKAFPDSIVYKGGGASLRTTSGVTMSCASVSGTGQVTGAKVGFLTLKLSGCTVNSHACTTAGMEAGVVQTGRLSVAPVYISKAAKEVGLDLTNPTGSFATFRCAGEPVGGAIRGSVIGRFTPINTLTKEFAVSFAGGAGATQNPSVYENEAGEKISASLEISWWSEVYEHGCLETTATLLGEKKMQLKA